MKIKSPANRKIDTSFPEMCEAVQYIDTLFHNLFRRFARPSPVCLYIRSFEDIYRFNKETFQSQY